MNGRYFNYSLPRPYDTVDLENISKSRVQGRPAMATDNGVASYGALGHVPLSTSGSFIYGSLWSKSESQLSKYCVVCEIGWCRCQQLTALSISTALTVTKLLVIEQLLHPPWTPPWRNFHRCPSSQQILATPLATEMWTRWLLNHWKYCNRNLRKYFIFSDPQSG